MQQRKFQRNTKIAVEESSGNVFADIGLGDADDLQIRAELIHVINVEIRAKGWNQGEAAERLGLTQSDISRMNTGKFDAFSQVRLQNVLRRLGIDIEIGLRKKTRGLGRIRVFERA